METVTTTTPPTDTPPYKQPGNRLTRSTDDKVVGGLAGGLGRYFGIDPVVFRIAFVVLTLAGGSGLLLYLVGWLMIPDDRGGTALRGFGGDRGGKLVAAALAGIGVLILLDNVTGSNGDIPLGLVLVGVGGLFLWSRRKQDAQASGGTPPVPPTPPAPPVPPTTPTDLDPPTDVDPAEVTSAFAPPAPPAEPRARSVVVPVTLSLLAVLAGALTLVGVSATTGLALALVVTGGGLVVGAWRGRAKWLIPVGLAISVALAAASVVDVPIRGGSGEVTYHPVALEEIRTPYRLSAGEMILDLHDIDLRGQTVTILATVAAGQLTIVVPDGAAFDLDAHVGAGNLSLLGRESDGLDIGRKLAEPGGEGGGRLVLRARAGVGVVEVRRAFA